MITIFKNKKDIPHDMEYVELNDIYFNQNTSLKLDEMAEKITAVTAEGRVGVAAENEVKKIDWHHNHRQNKF